MNDEREILVYLYSTSALGDTVKLLMCHEQVDRCPGVTSDSE